MGCFCQRGKHVDGFGVPGVFDGAVGSAVGGVEWQWRQAGSRRLGGWCWRCILRVVAWCREPGRRSSLSRGQRPRDRRLQGRVARRVEGHVVDVPFFKVMKRDQQERVPETTAEQVVTATKAVA